jgi:UDP-glucose 4-epimerase
LYVGDCIDAILTVVEKVKEGKTQVFNLGTEESCEVNESIGWIADRLGISPRLTYAGGDRGWIGDSPLILLDTAKVRALGWKPTLTIREGIVRTLDYLRQNPWLMDRHA